MLKCDHACTARLGHGSSAKVVLWGLQGLASIQIPADKYLPKACSHVTLHVFGRFTATSCTDLCTRSLLGRYHDVSFSMRLMLLIVIDTTSSKWVCHSSAGTVQVLWAGTRSGNASFHRSLQSLLPCHGSKQVLHACPLHIFSCVPATCTLLECDACTALNCVVCRTHDVPSGSLHNLAALFVAVA